MAVLLALLAAAGWGSSDYAAGNASRRSSAVSVVILTHLVAVIALLAIVVDLGPVWTMVVDLAGGEEPETGVGWTGPRIAGSPTPTDIAWGVAAGLGGGFGAMLLFRGLGGPGARARCRRVARRLTVGRPVTRRTSGRGRAGWCGSHGRARGARGRG